MRQFAVLLLLAPVAALGQDLPKTEIPFERLFQYPLISGRSPASPSMSPNGKQIVFGWNQTGDRRLDLWKLDFPSGKPRLIVEADKIDRLPNQDDKRTDDEKAREKLYDGGIGGATWSPDSSELLFSYRGRTWMCDAEGKNLQPVFDGNEGAFGFRFSPDGRYLSYQKGQNLYRRDRKTNLTKQLTFLSEPGTSIDSYVWSPDSQNIAILQSNSSKLGNHVMMDFTKDRATVVNIQRMWNGDLSQDNRVGIVSADGGLVRWCDGIPKYSWPSEISWAPNSANLAVGWFKEDFKEWTISVFPAESLKKFDAYTEKAPSNYVPDFRHVLWARDSKEILFTTDILDGKFGWRSVMGIGPNGKNLRRVFSENYDVANVARPKDTDRLILVTMGRSPLKTEITLQEPDGRRKVIVVEEHGFASPQDFDEAGLPLYSDDGQSIASMASNPTRNGELFSVSPGPVRRLTESQLPEFNKIKWADHREITFTAPDGKTIHATLITKPGLDLSKKHPAFLSNLYANSGKLDWGGYLENFAAMELGFVVLKVDFRSSWGYGGEFNAGYYRAMGLVDADEAVAAKNYLASLGYVDPDRVGLWGWSYGGYLTCMTLLTKPNVFKAGVAVASVTDWRSYNEWYTRRRLGLVKDDEEIFKKTSPISYADGLQDELLLVHGILDDNVLFQDTARLMQRMIEKGRHFELMAYPEDDHSIGKNWSRPHVMTTILRYLYRTLGG